MRFGLEEPNWPYVAARLAQSTHHQQVAFIKAFLRECNSWGTAHQVEMQLAAINHDLTQKEREQLKMLSFTEGDN